MDFADLKMQKTYAILKIITVQRKRYILRFITIIIAKIVAAVMFGSSLIPPVSESVLQEIVQMEQSEQTDPGDIAQSPGCPLPLNDWRMVLVNREHPLDVGYQMELTELANGMQVDSRCYADLTAMLDACRDAGCVPVICSAYRSVEQQTILYRNKVRAYEQRGMDRDQAAAEAAKVVAVPGCSEHHLGLAVDIVDQKYQRLDTAQEDTPVQQWLMEHCWEYGFILRYPNGKSEITGIIYEPWHYRYVGCEVAMEIRELGVCFEEYIALFRDPPEPNNGMTAEEVPTCTFARHAKKKTEQCFALVVLT